MSEVKMSFTAHLAELDRRRHLKPGQFLPAKIYDFLLRERLTGLGRPRDRAVAALGDPHPATLRVLVLAARAGVRCECDALDK